MQNDGNKYKALLIRQGIIFFLAVVWLFLVILKDQIPETLRLPIFIGLAIISLLAFIFSTWAALQENRGNQRSRRKNEREEG